MYCSIQAIVIGNNVYVGGGYNYANAATVMEYSLHTRSWATLPPYESGYFGMAAVNGQLVLVGGINMRTGNVTDVLGVWNERSRTWTHPFPKMPTARRSLTITSYQNWLVAAGGEDGRGFRTKAVELLHTPSLEWYIGSPLPNEGSEMSSANWGNMWYLSGGFSDGASKQLHAVCLDELISQAISQPKNASYASPWQALPEIPLYHSAILIVNGALLAVGGWRSSAIHVYKPASKSWSRVDHLPSERWQCACTVLPSGEIFVVGGVIESDPTNSVDVAFITQCEFGLI